jgi:hypothetical protein
MASGSQGFLFSTVSLMDDQWPTPTCDLTLSKEHLVWIFVHKGSSQVQFLVLSIPGHCMQQVTINVCYIPALACMDQEYWDAMTETDEEEHGLDSVKMKQKKKYLQMLRHRVVQAIMLSAEEMLLDGSWPMEIAHGWLVRTYHHLSHCDIGREQYQLDCQYRRSVPYNETITWDGKSAPWSIPALS